MPIYLAAIGPKNVALAAEIGDGWLPIFFAPEHYAENFAQAVEAGFASAGNGKSLETFDIAPTVPVIVGDDLPNCWMQVKPFLALYIGGMGAKKKNFYKDFVSRSGFADAAEKIQDLYLAGKKNEAIMSVPDAMVDAFYLCGPPARIREQFSRWKDAPVGTFIVGTPQKEAVRLMAELVL